MSRLAISVMGSFSPSFAGLEAGYSFQSIRQPFNGEKKVKNKKKRAKVTESGRVF